MARSIGPKCRLCRREGVQLFLKGDRCDTVKCAVKKREKVPGMHEFRRMKHTDYGMKLREKQKVKRYYGLTERQFQRVFREAARRDGNTGETLLVLLERRLDNVAYLLGLASSRATARQMIAHGNINLNGKRMDIPSALVSVGDVVTPGKRESAKAAVKRSFEERARHVPAWLTRDDAALEGKVTGLPTRRDVPLEVNEQLIVEFCSL
ncbi:MAG: 30S ribosomal protein S4 [Planctomycetia bacterium]|jgi:small subunit ribosomal protein S4|nr:30S ribosomal protein S4 [Planctomycetia bacterium]